jgi:hypothetical protein
MLLEIATEELHFTKDYGLLLLLLFLLYLLKSLIWGGILCSILMRYFRPFPICCLTELYCVILSLSLSFFCFFISHVVYMRIDFVIGQEFVESVRKRTRTD